MLSAIAYPIYMFVHTRNNLIDFCYEEKSARDSVDLDQRDCVLA